MSLRLDGRNPLAYMGVNPNQPPQLVVNKVRPTTINTNFNLGTLWLIPEQDSPLNSMELWTLISLNGNVATWVELYPGSGGGGTADFVTDAGTASEVGGSINILGGSNINTAGAGSTVTVNLDDTVSVSGAIIAGTTLTSISDTNVGADLIVTDDVTVSSFGAGVVQSDGAGLLSSTNGTNGQLLIGGGAAPVWNNLTSTGGTVTITNGANAINLESMGGGGSSAGSLVFLAEQTATADASLDFTTQITNTYNEFFILLENLNPTVAGKNFIAQLSINGGGAWISTGYINTTGGATNGITLAAQNGGTNPTTDSFTDGSVYLINATSGAGIVGIGTSDSAFYDPAGMSSQGANASGFYATPNLVVNALRFMYDDGSVFDGTVKIYGLATTPIPMTGGGSLVFIEKQTATADATLDFTTGVTNNYNNFYVIIQGVKPTVAEKNLVCQISTDGGSTWVTTNYSNSSDPAYTAGLILAGSTGGGQPSVDSYVAANSVLYNLTSGVGFIQTTTGLNATFYNSATGVISNTGGNAAYETINTVGNALRFKFDDSSVFDGTISLYAYSDTPVTPVASGGLVFLEQQTASGATELDFTTSVTSTYDDYMVLVKNAQPTVANKDFIVQLSVDGGGTWIATGYINNSGTQTTGISLINLGAATIPSITSFSDGWTTLHNVTSGVNYVQSTNTVANIFDPNLAQVIGSGGSGVYATQSTAVNALRFKYSDGSAFDGIVKLYGYVD